MQLRLWDVSQKKCEWTVQAHNGQVWSIVAAPDGDSFFTVGNDKTIKKWSLDKAKEGDHDLPVDTWLSDVSVILFGKLPRQFFLTFRIKHLALILIHVNVEFT